MRKRDSVKGDKFVGDYYVKYDKENQKQIKNLIDKGISKDDASKQTELSKGATNLLKLWEEKDKSTIELWKMMNNWVYEGFNYTFKSIGINFDKNYYESETYLLGKENIKIGLKKNIFFEKEDGSVWVDLSKQSLDNKLLLRSDGTSVYITQDIGTAIKRFEDHPKIKKQIYTVGNEQDYHFKVLFKILEKLGYDWAKECYHLSYGMVDLPDGKMKSREGNVVDADDLVNHMIKTAKSRTEELGKIDDFDTMEISKPYHTKSINRSKLWIMETPQVARKEWLVQGMTIALDKKLVITDEVSALELIGKKVSLLNPEYPNPNITSHSDWPYLKFLLSSK